MPPEPPELPLAALVAGAVVDAVEADDEPQADRARAARPKTERLATRRRGVLLRPRIDFVLEDGGEV